MGEKNIIAECYADTLLVKQLNYDFHPFHSSIGEVARTMVKHFPNKVAIAIIDDDKKSIPSYFKNECREIKVENGVILMKHEKEDHYVIKISPAFEEFMNGAARECGMELFEKDIKKLKRITKDSKLHSNSKFVSYLNRLIAKNPESIRALKRLIQYAQSGNKRGFKPK